METKNHMMSATACGAPWMDFEYWDPLNGVVGEVFNEIVKSDLKNVSTPFWKDRSGSSNHYIGDHSINGIILCVHWSHNVDK